MDGGEETKVLEAPVGSGDWAFSRKGIYFVTGQPLTRGRRSAIRFFDFDSGQGKELFRKEGPFGLRDMAVSPDEEWVLYAERPYPTSELMLVENLH